MIHGCAVKVATPRELATAKRLGARVMVPKRRNFRAYVYQGFMYLEGKR